jgi:DNA-binding response OmpR family regulator
MKRILLLVDDPLITNFYREKFQASGFSVETARNSETASRLLADKSIDLALANPVIASARAHETVSALRGGLPAEKPLLVFSKLPPGIVSAVQNSGATKLVSYNGEQPSATVLREVHTALQLPLGGASASSDEIDEAWLKSVLKAAPEAINAMRISMHTFIKDTRKLDVLYALFCELHKLSERAAMIGLNPVFKMTSAIEALVYDLYAMPEQINPLVLRTISQSIDFLSTLFDEANAQRVQDPSTADVFVVDDEADARKLVSAAMNLVNLKITCAADTDMALTVLEDNTFNLIFLDINLAGHSGFDLCTKVRQLEDHRKTPIVFLTGAATFQNRAQSSLSGGNDFVGKPFNLLELGVKALVWIFKGQLGLA